jgi:predicted ATPase
MNRSNSGECESNLLLDALRFKPAVRTRHGYPFDLPLVQSLEILSFEHPVTFFVGENGSGKSTILEALATSVRLPTVGGQDSQRDPELEAARALSKYMQPVWRRKTHRGFFMRSADFFSFRRSVNSLREELRNLADEYPTLPSGAASRSKSAMLGQVAALEARYEGDPTQRSHGEGFLQLFRSRFVAGGLYLLDEPEVALSMQSQLGLLAMMREVTKGGGQMVIATHSPILMAYPEATILDFSQAPPVPVAYDDVQNVQLMRDFLKMPQAFLHHLWK